MLNVWRFLMKKIGEHISGHVYILLFLMIFLSYGCGNKEAKSTGCPAGSLTANATDKIVGPANETLSITNFGGGSVRYAPLVFTVYEADGVTPKNNICLELFTGGVYAGGVWYPDALYEANPPIVGDGPMNKITASTNVSGKVQVYWTTGSMPASQPSYTDTVGARQDGPTLPEQEWINVYSGAVAAQWKTDITINGCSKGLAICP
jgi:hypothetical protein